MPPSREDDTESGLQRIEDAVRHIHGLPRRLVDQVLSAFAPCQRLAVAEVLVGAIDAGVLPQTSELLRRMLGLTDEQLVRELISVCRQLRITLRPSL